MVKILNILRTKPELYNMLKIFYGKTIGLWHFKELYLKYIGVYNGKKRLKLLNKKESINAISKGIKSEKPFMYARYGSSEFRAIMNDKDFPLVCFYSGFFPQDKKLLPKFREVYIKSSKFLDVFLVWNFRNHFFNEIKLLKKLPNIKEIILDAGVGNPQNSWIRDLKGKKILVIHPFKKTIEHQHKKRAKLGILPKIKSLEVIRAVQTIAGNKDERFKDWFEALDYMKKEINKKDFDIAILGCGAYGLPLAAHVKSIGKQALHLAGETQLLFGIKGKRWVDDGLVEMENYWISPLDEDKIQNYKKIEGGCYW